jgi:hypothetical protein
MTQPRVLLSVTLELEILDRLSVLAVEVTSTMLER